MEEIVDRFGKTAVSRTLIDVHRLHAVNRQAVTVWSGGRRPGVINITFRKTRHRCAWPSYLIQRKQAYQTGR
jgi:hypothetical protein